MTAKEQFHKIIDEQPDDSSMEEILHELAFHKMVMRGLKDVDEGNYISEEEMDKKIDSWF